MAKYVKRPRKVITVRERLLNLSIPEPNSGCWLWLGAIHQAPRGLGYGHFIIRGKNIPAHRASWQEFNGPIPENTKVLHKCDVSHCINPSHLYLGNQSDNNIDMWHRGFFNRHGFPRARMESRYGL